ncbi:hypothetical protein FRB93_013469 [Tulasnella sp. JGI-2019a]|nr:hypothetical protein FRB93_013469 [Tulasnella sp. JGI-2019a]
MFSSPAPSQANLRRPARTQPSYPTSRQASVAISPPRTPRHQASSYVGGSPFSTSRYGTPSATLRMEQKMGRARHADDSMMDLDAQSERSVGTVGESSAIKYFAHRTELSVSQSAHLPREVQNITARADFQEDAWSGAIDATTGYAFVMSNSVCFAWCYRTMSVLPTCYIFPTPRDVNIERSRLTPVAEFVPYDGAREPGLLVVSPSGEIRYWESVDAGLSGAEKYHQSQVNMDQTEYVKTVYRYENLIYIVLTSGGQLHRLTISSSMGQCNIIATKFKSGTYLQPITRYFFAGNAKAGDSGAGIALALGSSRAKHSRDAWLLTENQLQKWEVSVDSWEKLVDEMDVRGFVYNALQRAGIARDGAHALDEELLDVAVDSNGLILILISYAGKSDAHSFSASNTPTRTYAIVRIKEEKCVYTEEGFDPVSYDMIRDPRPGTAPRMILVDGGASVVVHFGSVVVVASLTKGATFRQTLSLKDPRNRTLGFGDAQRIDGTNTWEINAIVAHNGLLNFDVHADKVQAFYAGTQTNQLKSTLEQAIFYGSMDENPFLFSLSPHHEGNLDAAATSLSREIMNSNAYLMRPILDLRSHLTYRIDLLRSLVLFLTNNGVAGHLSISGKAQLSEDAEKLSVASSIWRMVNANSHSKSALLDALGTYMERTGEELGEDPLRIFFRHKVDQLGVLLFGVYDRVTLERTPLSMLLAGSRIACTAYEAVDRHRKDARTVYGMEQDDHRIAQWTSTASQVESFYRLYIAIAMPLARNHDRSTEVTLAEVAELREMLKTLANAVLALFSERGHHLFALTRETGNDRAYLELKQRSATVRQQVVGPLIINHAAPTAFKLMAQYEDFRLLAELCNRQDCAKAFGDDVDVLSDRYIMEFEDAFAFELYKWYQENGQLQKLIGQEDHHPEILGHFLEKYPDPRISWMHDIVTGDYNKAAGALAAQGEQERTFTAQKIVFSLEKLCQLAESNDMEALSDNDERQIQKCESALETVSMQEKLLEELREVAETEQARDPKSLSDDQAIVNRAARERNFGAATQNIIRRCTRQLFEHIALGSEDLIDLLTLKPSQGLTDGFFEACMICERAAMRQDQSGTLPPGRQQSALQTIWRRAFLSDPWGDLSAISGLTDDEANEQRSHTALFNFMQNLSHRQDSDHLWLDPAQATHETPSREQIAARYPQYSQSQVLELESVYEAERTLLEERRADGLDVLYAAMRMQLLGR